GGGVAAAPRQAHVHVDQHLAHPAVGRGVHGHVGVDGPGHLGGARRDHGTQPPAVEHLVGQEQVVAEPGGGHALDLPDGGAAEGAVPRVGQPPGQGGRLERLDVGPEPGAGGGGGHGGDVVVERREVDDQGRGGDVCEPHEPGRYKRHPADHAATKSALTTHDVQTSLRWTALHLPRG